MLEDRQYQLKQDLQSRDAKIALLEEEISLYKDEVENLRRALRFVDKTKYPFNLQHPVSRYLQKGARHQSVQNYLGARICGIVFHGVQAPRFPFYLDFLKGSNVI